MSTPQSLAVDEIAPKRVAYQLASTGFNWLYAVEKRNKREQRALTLPATRWRGVEHAHHGRLQPTSLHKEGEDSGPDALQTQL